MSEQENHIELLIKELADIKVWYKRMILACVVFILVGFGGGGVVIYKQNKMSEAISQAVPRSTIVMLDNVYKAQTNAMINLVNKNYQEAVRQFEQECEKIRSSIIMFNSEISTRGSVNSK